MHRLKSQCRVTTPDDSSHTCKFKCMFAPVINQYQIYSKVHWGDAVGVGWGCGRGGVRVRMTKQHPPLENQHNKWLIRLQRVGPLFSMLLENLDFCIVYNATPCMSSPSSTFPNFNGIKLMSNSYFTHNIFENITVRSCSLTWKAMINSGTSSS